MVSRKNKLFLFVLMAAGFIGSLSQNLLTSALPVILAAFGITAAVGQWLTTSYILFMGVMTALSAYMFYRLPTRLLVMGSVTIFAIGCAISMAAQSFPVLLAGRLIQAFGAGPTIPLLQIAVVYLYPPEHQGEALGLTGIIVGFAPAIGPTLSGLLVDLWGWRSIFAFLIGLALLVLALGHFALRELGERQRMPLDMLSVLEYSVGFTAFMLSVTFMKGGQVLNLRVLGTMALGLAYLAVFVRRQLGLAEPLLKITLLRNRSLAFGTILLGLAYVMNMAGTILVPLFNQTICPYSATVSGLILLPGSILIAALSPYSGRLVDRYGARVCCLTGMAFMLLGNLPFAFFREAAGIPAIVLAYAIRCLGMTFLLTPSTALAVQELELNDKPYGMAILNSFRQMSGALFSTILVVLATVTSLAGSSDIDLRGMHIAFAAMAALSVLGGALTLAVRERRMS